VVDTASFNAARCSCWTTSAVDDQKCHTTVALPLAMFDKLQTSVGCVTGGQAARGACAAGLAVMLLASVTLHTAGTPRVSFASRVAHPPAPQAGSPLRCAPHAAARLTLRRETPAPATGRLGAIMFLTRHLTPAVRAAAWDTHNCSGYDSVIVLSGPPAVDERTTQEFYLPWQALAPPAGLEHGQNVTNFAHETNATAADHGLRLGCLACADGGQSTGNGSVCPYGARHARSDGPAVVWVNASVLLSSHWYGLTTDDRKPNVTAVDAATWALRAMRGTYDHAWLVEDDVSWTQPGGLCRLVHRYKSRDDDLLTQSIFTPEGSGPWAWWWAADPWPPEHRAASLSVLLRASTRLMGAMANFTRSHERFSFLEVMFTSAASAAGLKASSFNKTDAGRLRCCDPYTWQSLPPNKTDAVIHPWKHSVHAFQSPPSIRPNTTHAPKPSVKPASPPVQPNVTRTAEPSMASVSPSLQPNVTRTADPSVTPVSPSVKPNITFTAEPSVASAFPSVVPNTTRMADPSAAPVSPVVQPNITRTAEPPVALGSPSVEPNTSAVSSVSPNIAHV